MGIYIFRPEVLSELLVGTDTVDFGREVIPQALERLQGDRLPHDGYWADIGTIPSFHQANLDLTLPLPPLNLYDPELRIFTHPRFLPGTKVNECSVRYSILERGEHPLGQPHRRLDHRRPLGGAAGSVIERSIVMGADTWETLPDGSDQIPIGIGRDCTIRNAIIDFNARIGDGCKLINADGLSGRSTTRTSRSATGSSSSTRTP